MAARTIGKYFPEESHPPSSNPAALDKINGRPVLWFDAATDESALWSDVAPVGITPPLTLVVTWIMASATSGTIGLQAQVEAITDGDATDLDATTSFDSVNNSSSVTVPATAGIEKQTSITLTNNDSIAAADYFRILVNRDADGSAIADTATGDLGIIAMELRDNGG